MNLWNYSRTVHRGDEVSLGDCYPVAFWPRGHEWDPTILPRLRILTRPPADAAPRYLDKWLAERVHEITWPQFWDLLESSNPALIAVQDTKGNCHVVYETSLNRKQANRMAIRRSLSMGG